MNPSAAPSVLIVEDERVVAKDLQQTLLDMGYDAFAIANSADEAVALTQAKRPDIVLMDIRIKGDRDGIDAAALLQSELPLIVIYLTAHADREMVDRAKLTKPYGYLLKPVNVAELRSALEIALHRRDVDAAQEKLRLSESRLVAIADSVPISIAYLDRNEGVQFSNRMFRELSAPDLDHASQSPSSLDDALPAADAAPRRRALGGERITFILDTVHEGETRKQEVSYIPGRDRSGAVTGVYRLAHDVTERERMSGDLHQVRADLETILNNVPADITSWRVDSTSRFANRTAETTFGFPPGGTNGKHVRDVFGTRRYADVRRCIESALAGQQCSQEQTDPRADGTVRYSRDHFVPEFKDGVVVGWYALSMDVTELRASYERIRELAQRLEQVREEERRAVAIVLHDGLAQDLFGIQLGLSHLKIQATKRAGVTQVYDELTVALSKCMEDTRQIANDLRPAGLANHRIATILDDHARYFGRQSNLAITVHETPSFPDLDEPTSILFFRAAQEALTNVARHARATAVAIELHADGGRVAMDITDDGVGITDAAMKKPRSLGLLGIRERFAALGGGLSVCSGSPAGTKISVYVPDTHREPALAM